MSQISIHGEVSTENGVDSFLARLNETEADYGEARRLLVKCFRRVYHGLAISTSLLLSADGELMPEAKDLIEKLQSTAGVSVPVFAFQGAVAPKTLTFATRTWLDQHKDHVFVVYRDAGTASIGWEVETIEGHFGRAGLAAQSILRVVREDDLQLLNVLGQEPNQPTPGQGRLGVFLVPLATSETKPGTFALLSSPRESTTLKAEWAHDASTFVHRPWCFPVVNPGESGGDPSKWAWQTLRDAFVFHPAVNLRETARLLADPPSDLFHALPRLAERAGDNLREARRLAAPLPKSTRPGETPGRPPPSGVSPEIDRLFDPHSGAITLSPLEWQQEVVLAGSGGGDLVDWLRGYFQEQLPDFWQHDRPCMMRVLFTPTKVLLRGESYYANMKNVSPFVRLGGMLEELGKILEQIGRPNADGEIRKILSFQCGVCAWKLLLALFDQVRNIALQLFLFTQAGQDLLGSELKALASKGRDQLLTTLTELTHKNGIHSLVRASVVGYYACLLLDHTLLAKTLVRMRSAHSSVAGLLLRSVNSYQNLTREADAVQRKKIGGLVRRWREADHPGENLLTALLASERLPTDGAPVTAVGIGWGGIEIPLVFDFLQEHVKSIDRNKRAVTVALWSHYRDPHKKVAWCPVLDSFTEQQQGVKGATVFLFDDNVLTGITLQRVRDELILDGARCVKIFVGRYSGERRLHHMRMPDHGVYNPEFLLREVGGYLGETPFSRSWSSEYKKYQNPIGIFSLARRRILECIHNNSTVELYDREGF